MNELDKLINKNSILKEKLPLLKEVFISFYGDLYRQKIEDSFNNLTIVSYMMPKSIEMNLNDADKEISRKFQIEFLQAISVEPSDENLKLFFDNVGFKYQILMPIVNIYELLARKEEKELSEYENKRLFENLSKILKTQITVDNLELAISYFQKIKPKYEEMIERYQQVFSKYQGLKQELERYEEKRIKLKKEFNIIFFEMLKDYLSKEDIMYIESCKNNPNSFYSGKLECNGLFCDYSFYQQGLIEFFNKESEDLLNNEETSSWKKEEIKNSRIKYFQKQGLDLGSNYDSYLNYPEIEKYYPDSKLISTIMKVKQELKRRLAEKQFELTPVYKEYYDYLNSLNLKTIDDSVDLLFYTEEVSYKLHSTITIGTYVSPVITNENKLHSLLYFDLNTTKSYQDQFLLHELNHIIESNLLSVNESNCVVKTGFDYLTIDLKEQDESDEERREFEYLNEIINELFSQEIHEKMNDAGIYIFNTKDDTKIQGGTAYETVRSLIINFYNYYKEDIKEARLNLDMTNFFNKVGKDNLITLNNLVVTFFDNFGGFAYYSLIQELRNGEETERTILYKKLLQESKDILNRMKNYQELNYLGKK